MSDKKEHIPIADTVADGLYLVHARNFSLGIYQAAKKEFAGIRYKFGDRFIDNEDHWDTGEPHGTAKPYRLLEAYVCPAGLNADQAYDHMFGYLDDAGKRYKADTDKLGVEIYGR